MQYREAETNRQKVNDSVNKLSGMGNTKRTVWFNKRRFGNI